MNLQSSWNSFMTKRSKIWCWISVHLIYVLLDKVILVFPVMWGLICDVLFLLFFVFDVLFFSKGTSWMRSRLRNIGRRLNWSYRTSVMMLWEWLMSTLSLWLQLVNPLCFTIRCEDLCLILCRSFCFGVIFFILFCASGLRDVEMFRLQERRLLSLSCRI